MAFVGENFGSWTSSQPHWHRFLKLTDPKIRCLPFCGLGHALSDLLYGLKDFWPTKKDLVVQSWGHPLVWPSVEGFMRMGSTLTKLPTEDIESSPFLTEPSKDLLAGIFVRDHCFSGEIQKCDSLLKAFNEKRIVHVEIQGPWSLNSTEGPLPFGVQIRIIDANKALALLGPRVRLIPRSAAVMDWTPTEIWTTALAKSQKNAQEYPEEVRQFERQVLAFTQGLAPYFEDLCSRRWDRSVIRVPGVNGDFFLNRLLREIKEVSMAPPGFEHRCETTNLSRWSGPLGWDWWGKIPLNERDQRSLVILSASFIKEHLTPEIFVKVYKDCLQETKKIWRLP